MQLEKRSIEFVPHRERYGTARRLFTIWFSSNLQVTALMVGTLGIAAGLSLGWTLLALLVGNLAGTVFMAAHSAQGPQLGVPQMIQSRAQFGVLGAAIPLIVMVSAAVLFLAASAVMLRNALKGILPIDDNQAIILLGVLTWLVSVVGYELIHRLGAWMTVLSTALFAIAGLLILLQPASVGGALTTQSGFSFAAFNLVVAQAASWTLGYGPYVADYSRYLPAKVKTRDTFWSTYSGCALGSLAMMALGALLAARLPAALSLDPGNAIAQLFGPWMPLALTVVILGVLQYNVLCLYSAYMSSVTIYGGFARLRQVSLAGKSTVMALLALMATLIAIATQHDFDTFFADILIGQLYLLIPWSAINLVDYYWVRRAQYRIDDLYDANGVYGRWNRKTLLVYAAAVVVTMPFMKLSFFEGYLARLLGSDVSWIPGLLVAGALYYFVHGQHAKGVNAAASDTCIDHRSGSER